ncbi:hypothetical protein QBC43DRAFT_291960 [Cladorrhinum sp. PSN259]|nr:hypothetical protein QBC43DRAFT_291960 [Cladorrhinum sp. PSN259]
MCDVNDFRFYKSTGDEFHGNEAIDVLYNEYARYGNHYHKILYTVVVLNEKENGYRAISYAHMYLNLAKPSAGDHHGSSGSSSPTFTEPRYKKQWDYNAVFGFVMDAIEDKTAPDRYKFLAIRFIVNPVHIITEAYKRGLVTEEQACRGKFH